MLIGAQNKIYRYLKNIFFIIYIWNYRTTILRHSHGIQILYNNISLSMGMLTKCVRISFI